eukprot:124150-Prymnesium_polylepis.1
MALAVRGLRIVTFQPEFVRRRAATHAATNSGMRSLFQNIHSRGGTKAAGKDALTTNMVRLDLQRASSIQLPNKSRLQARQTRKLELKT